MAKQVMLGVRLDAATRAAFKAWCAARQVTAQAVLRDDVALTPVHPCGPAHPARSSPGAHAEDLAQAPVGAADGLDDRAQAPLVRGMNCGKRSTVHEWHTMAVRFLPRPPSLIESRTFVSSFHLTL